MSEIFQIEVSSSPRLLQVVRAAVGQYGRVLKLAEPEVYRLQLAVDEACSNIIRHAYKGDPAQRIVITFTLSDDRLEILLRDFGLKPDPEELRPRPPDPTRPGGLGMPLILSIMDEVNFDLDPEQGTALRLVKYLACGSGERDGRRDTP